MAFIGKKPTAAPLTSSDVADWIITNAKLAQDIISGDTALGATPADTDEFLVSDAGTLKRVDYSYIKGGGITEADQWRVTSNKTGSDTSPDYFTANLERVDTAGFNKLGTGMSESSGVFTFPSTGIWHIGFTGVFEESGSGDNWYFHIYSTLNNSAYTQMTSTGLGKTVSRPESGYTETLLDVTDTSNVKVKFATTAMSDQTYVYGSTSLTYTNFLFTRLGDT